MTEKHFNAEITFQSNPLAWNSLERIKSNLEDIRNYENSHSSFDIIDPQGQVAAIYLFQKNGQLFARGEKYTKVLRNPENVYEFLRRDKKVKKIILVYKEEKK